MKDQNNYLDMKAELIQVGPETHATNTSPDMQQAGISKWVIYWHILQMQIEKKRLTSSLSASHKKHNGLDPHI